MKRLSFVEFFSIAILCVFIAAGCNRKSATDQPASNRPAPDFTVTDRDIFKETDSKARDKYFGKQIAVRGRVTSVYIEKNLTGHVALMPGVSGNFDPVEKESVSSIKEGQTVTMQCLGGEHWTMTPDLSHCAIINVE